MSAVKKRRITGDTKPNSTVLKPNLTRAHWAGQNAYLANNQRLEKQVRELQMELKSKDNQWRIHMLNMFKEKDAQIIILKQETQKLKQIIDTYVVRHPECKEEFSQILRSFSK